MGGWRGGREIRGKQDPRLGREGRGERGGGRELGVWAWVRWALDAVLLGR